MLLLQRFRQLAKKGDESLSRIAVLNCAPVSSALEGEFQRLGVTVVRTGSSNGVLASLDAASRIVASGFRGVVVVHSPAPASVLRAVRRLRVFRGRLLVVVHSTKFRRTSAHLGRWTGRWADRTLSVSRSVQDAQQHFGLATEVVYGGVDVEAIGEAADVSRRDRTEVLRAHHIPAGAFVVCSVGTLKPLKGHARLIQAAADIGNEVHVLLVGDGESRADLLALGSALAISDRVHLVGHVAEPWTVTGACDLYCQPSDHEGLPVAVMEAQAAGLPVVGFDVGGIAEALGDPVLGAALPPGRQDLLTAEIAARRAGHRPPADRAHIKAAAARWSLQRYTDEFEQVVHDLAV